MKIVPFIAENAPAALAKIHAELGPDAVVLSVRQLPAHGFKRLLHQPGHVEVLACLMEEKIASPPLVDPVKTATGYVPFELPEDSGMFPETAPTPRPWQSITWLESMGLLPAFADRVQDRVHARYGNKPPPMPIAEWSAVRGVLTEFWRPRATHSTGPERPHVFIGPPGSGKTTVLCKWLTTAVLTEERKARVWRLDGATANTSEFLTVHCEMLGVPVTRFWSEPDTSATGLSFIDLPGVEIGDKQGLTALRDQLAVLPAPHVHLVLNAAYETAVMWEQFHAFAPFQPQDVSFTHLDEERRRVKLWNFVLGTNCSLNFLSAGQKIPGEFLSAESGLLFPHENNRK